MTTNAYLTTETLTYKPEDGALIKKGNNEFVVQAEKLVAQAETKSISKILKKINEISRDSRIREIKASDMIQNSIKKYSFADAKAILPVVNKVLIDKGVIFVIENDLKVSSQYISKSSKDNREVQYLQVFVQGTGVFYDVDSGEFIKYAFYGQGTDTNDKALSMANTIAKKLLFCTAFGIAVGEEDQENQQDEEAGKPKLIIWLENANSVAGFKANLEKQNIYYKSETTPKGYTMNSQVGSNRYTVEFDNEADLNITIGIIKQKGYSYNEQYKSWSKQKIKVSPSTSLLKNN